MPYFCAVPLETPLDPKGVRVIPSAGPYYVTSYIPGESVVLERNSNYTGSRPHHLDRMELTIGVTQRRADAQIEAGTADYALDGVDDNEAPRLKARYGTGSPAARNGRQRYFVNKLLAIRFIVLNTHRPLFHDVRLRQAINYAIDRQQLDEIAGDAATDGPVPHAWYAGLQGCRHLPVHAECPRRQAPRRHATKDRDPLHAQRVPATVGLPAIGADHEDEPGRDRDRRRDEDVLV